MDYIQPLALQTWLESVLAGTPDIFIALALLVIFGMAGYFRMQGFSMFIMVGIFALLFVEIIPFSLVTLIAIFGGLAIGYVLSNITSR